jgi:chromosome segregation ATPase
MTFVGKILVIVVMALSLIFLGLSAVTVSTAKNWKAAIENEQKTIKDLTKKLADAKGQVDIAGKTLEDAKSQFDTEKKTLDTRNAGIQDEISRDNVQINSTRTQWAAAHETSKGVMLEVAAKRTQINELRARIAAIQKQSLEFKKHQTELTDLIRETERLLETVQQNQSDLQGR